MSQSRIKKPDHHALNPCHKEQELTYKCFNDNNFDKERCDLYIQNYKTCRKFWAYVQTQRRRKGIAPALPPVEERESVKKEYLENYRP